MAKAMRMMEENVSVCDAIVFVLDARAPAASYNLRLTMIARNKPVLFVLNKGDLADGRADSLLAAIKKSGKNAVKIAASAQSSARILREKMAETVKEKAERYAARGIAKPFRFMVAGIPNTGKSTIINLLSGGKKAQTGDKAGVTRSKQWVKCEGFDLLDTPGTMPPACENQVLARRLAYIGSVSDDILAMDEIALSLLEEMYAVKPQCLSERFGIEGGTPLEMLDMVCRKRGFILRGGEYDYERGERALIDDLRKGRLGRVTFDSEEDLRGAGLI